MLRREEERRIKYPNDVFEVSYAELRDDLNGRFCSGAHEEHNVRMEDLGHEGNLEDKGKKNKRKKEEEREERVGRKEGPQSGTAQSDEG